jgi:1,4-dihydroxy-2-naphthoate octaprenyltransferase
MIRETKTTFVNRNGITWKVIAITACAILAALFTLIYNNLIDKVKATDDKITNHEQAQSISDNLMTRKIDWLINATTMLADKQKINLPPTPKD